MAAFMTCGPDPAVFAWRPAIGWTCLFSFALSVDPHDDTVLSDGCYLDFYVLDLDLTYFICRITASCNISAISLQFCTVGIRVASCNRMGLVCLVVL